MGIFFDWTGLQDPCGEPCSHRLTRPASDDALIINGNAVLHMKHQLAIEMKIVMLRDKYIVLNILD